jgi:hypothetical protein
MRDASNTNMKYQKFIKFNKQLVGRKVKFCEDLDACHLGAVGQVHSERGVEDAGCKEHL